MVGYPEEGVEVSWKTSAKYDMSGFIKTPVTWFHAEHGTSHEAVKSRTRARYNRHPTATEWAVRYSYEETAPVVREYFGTHAVTISQVFFPGQGWVRKNCVAGRSAIRQFAKDGATAIAFAYKGRDADFQVDELFTSMRTRKPTMQALRCATVGHGDHPATHEVSYNYRGGEETTTEMVCKSCADAYSCRPVLVGYTARKLGA
jgi:hypothetical protein